MSQASTALSTAACTDAAPPAETVALSARRARRRRKSWCPGHSVNLAQMPPLVSCQEQAALIAARLRFRFWLRRLGVRFARRRTRGIDHRAAFRRQTSTRPHHPAKGPCPNAISDPSRGAPAQTRAPARALVRKQFQHPRCALKVLLVRVQRPLHCWRNARRNARISTSRRRVMSLPSAPSRKRAATRSNFDCAARVGDQRRIQPLSRAVVALLRDLKQRLQTRRDPAAAARFPSAGVKPAHEAILQRPSALVTRSNQLACTGTACSAAAVGAATDDRDA